METLFKLINILIVPFWIVLVVYPKANFTKRWMYTYQLHAVLGTVYIAFLLLGMLQNSTGGSMDSLANLRLSFTNDLVLIGAWIHYLIFDLFVGTWVTKKCLDENISNLIKIPSLFFTLMFGPFGLLIFMVLRKVQIRA